MFLRFQWLKVTKKRFASFDVRPLSIRFFEYSWFYLLDLKLIEKEHKWMYLDTMRGVTRLIFAWQLSKRLSIANMCCQKMCHNSQAEIFFPIHIFNFFRIWKKAFDVSSITIRVARFSWYNIPKRGKIYQITTKYTKLPQNIPNYHKIYQISIEYIKWP
jgi:hypothetical protein